MAVMGLISRIRGRKTALTNQADKRSVYAYRNKPGAVVMNNILIMPNGTLAPRYEENLKQLHAYIRRRYKTKNIFDRRTRAWKYLVNHDSEAKQELAQRLPRAKATTEVQKNATRKEWQNHGE